MDNFCSYAEKKLESFETWLNRRMLRIYWKDMVTNEEVYRRMNIKQSLLVDIVRRQMSFLGHVLRKEEMGHLVVTGFVDGKRARGRQRDQFGLRPTSLHGPFSLQASSTDSSPRVATIILSSTTLSSCSACFFRAFSMTSPCKDFVRAVVTAISIMATIVSSLRRSFMMVSRPSTFFIDIMICFRLACVAPL